MLNQCKSAQDFVGLYTVVLLDFIKLSRGSLVRVWECPPKPIQGKGKIHLFKKVEITLSDRNGLWILSQIGLLILGALSVQQELPLANPCIAIRTLKNKMMESWRLIKRKIISFYYAHVRAHFFSFLSRKHFIFFQNFAYIWIYASGIVKRHLY